MIQTLLNPVSFGCIDSDLPNHKLNHLLTNGQGQIRDVATPLVGVLVDIFRKECVRPT